MLPRRRRRWVKVRAGIVGRAAETRLDFSSTDGVSRRAAWAFRYIRRLW